MLRRIVPDSRSCEVRTLPPDTSEYVEQMRQFQKTEESENCRAEIKDNIEKSVSAANWRSWSRTTRTISCWSFYMS